MVSCSFSRTYISCYANLPLRSNTEIRRASNISRQSVLTRCTQPGIVGEHLGAGELLRPRQRQKNYQDSSQDHLQCCHSIFLVRSPRRGRKKKKKKGKTEKSCVSKVGDGCWAVLLFSQSGCLDRLRAVAHQKEIARDGARIGFCQINGINGTTAPFTSLFLVAY